MTLLNWFLEEETLKDYDNFKREFYEDPDEYNYAISSLLGNLVWDLTPVNPGPGTIGTLVAPNIHRRNHLYPFQAALTEKWKAIGAVFSHSWLNALNRYQREALVMRSFIDTANINEEMTNARRQSFDLRTSEFSGRGFISFIQEHCLQNANNQIGGTPVSLPHTENMVRIFKDWVERSGSPPEDDTNDTLFRRSCALSLRDKCIYARALFSTRLCITVLEMWEQIIRAVELTRGHTSKPNDVTLDCAPVAAVTEVEVPPPKQSKSKKKKKGKAGKKTRRIISLTDVEDKPEVEVSESVMKTDGNVLEFGNSEDEFAAASGTEQTKSSGVSSPTGTGGEDSNLLSSPNLEFRGQRGIHTYNTESSTLSVEPTPATPIEVSGGSIAAEVSGPQSDIPITTDRDLQENLDKFGRNNVDVSNSSEEDRGIECMSLNVFWDSEFDKLVVGSITTIQSPSQAVAVNCIQVDEEKQSEEPEAEWLPVTGKKRKNQRVENPRQVPNNHQAGKRVVFGRRQSNRGLVPWKSQLDTTLQLKQTTFQHPSIAHLHPPIQPVVNTLLPGVTIAGPQNTRSVEALEEIDSLTISNTPMSQISKPLLAETEASGSGGTIISLADEKSQVCFDCNGGTAIADAGDHACVMDSRKASLTESETTDILIRVKGKKVKSHRRKAKATDPTVTERAFENSLCQLKSDVFAHGSLNLETVTFFCAVCRRPRSYHHSLPCSLCGPNSTIRYCSVLCQREDFDHWRLCGLARFSVPIIIPGSNLTCQPNKHSIIWMTPAFARQRMLLAEQSNIDYFIFHPCSSSPDLMLVLDDGKEKLQFSKLREKLFQHQDIKTVILMYRIIQSYLRDRGIMFPSQDLASQLFSEFGVNPLLSPTSSELRITSQDWVEAGI